MTDDFDDTVDGVKWRVAMRAEVEQYLERHRVHHGPVPLMPEYTLAPVVSLWACKPDLWLIAGDLPTDHLALPRSMNRRIVLQAFATRWARAARAMRAGEPHPEFSVGNFDDRAQQLEIAEALASRADSLRELAVDDQDDAREAREACYARMFGGPAYRVWHPSDDSVPHVDVYQFRPTERRPFWTLVTGGMSDLRQPGFLLDADDCAPRAELVMYVREPKPWMASVLSGMAKMPFDRDTLLYCGHTVPTGKPMTAEPSELTSYVFDEPHFGDARQLDVSVDRDAVALLWLRPITESERAYAIEHSCRALREVLDSRGVDPVVDEQRKSAI